MSRRDVAGGPILHALNGRVKARRVPSARSVEVPQDDIDDVCFVVEQAEQSLPKQVHVLPCPAARHSAQWHAHGFMWRGALPEAALR